MSAKKTTTTTNPLTVGQAVLIRTVTHYYTGRILTFTKEEIVLSEAAWIADTGRFAAALKDGTLSEVEPYCDVVSVNRGAVVDITTWRHDLPRNTK